MSIDYSDASVDRPVIASIRALVRDVRGRPEERRSAGRPFVTIARQAGAGATSLAERLIERLNADRPDPPWKTYDRELIEKVAADHDLEADLVAELPERPHSLLDDLAEGLRFERSRPTDEFIYGKVIATIRTLATAGHAVIVGRGGVYCTQDLPGGVHIQLVAPLPDRVRAIAAQRGISEADAAEDVQRTDMNREAFYRRFWSESARTLDRFTLTINTAAVDEAQQVEHVRMLVDAAAKRTSPGDAR